MTHKLLKIASIISACLMATLVHGQQPNIDIRGEPLTTAEITAMSPVCKLIVVERSMIHLGAGDGPLAEFAHLFEEPRYQLAKGNPHIHHYCWALVSKQRYFRASGKTKREYWYSQYKGDIEYVLRHTNKNWPHFDVLYLELASMHMIRGEYLAGIQKADQALGYNSANERAHLLKFDAYESMGNKKAAIEAAKEGLEKNPDSDRLRKRLVGLGVPVPPKRQPEPLKPEVSPPATVENTEREEAEQPPNPTTHNVVNKTAPHTEPEATPDATPAKSNPYCRFCP